MNKYQMTVREQYKWALRNIRINNWANRRIDRADDVITAFRLAMDIQPEITRAALAS